MPNHTRRRRAAHPLNGRFHPQYQRLGVYGRKSWLEVAVARRAPALLGDQLTGDGEPSPTPAPYTRGEVHADMAKNRRAGRRGFAGAVVAYRPGGGTEGGRHSQALSPRQPGQHVDPRRGDDLHRDSDDRGVQQLGRLRPAGAAGKPAIGRARSRNKLGMERRRQDSNVQIARRRQVARRHAVYRGRCQMHLGPSARQRQR